MLIIIESQWEYVRDGGVSPSVGLTIFKVKIWGNMCVCIYDTHICYNMYIWRERVKI